MSEHDKKLKELTASLQDTAESPGPKTVDKRMIELDEKVKALSDQLAAIDSILRNVDRVVDDLLKRSRERNVEVGRLYRKLQEVLPEVLDGMKH